MINLQLPWPPTVNTYYTVVRGRKILGKRGRQFKKDAKDLLAVQKLPSSQTGRISVTINANPPDRRKRDLDNLLKPILDCLSEVVFEDDSQIDDLRIIRREVVKGGDIRVYITEIDE